MLSNWMKRLLGLKLIEFKDGYVLMTKLPMLIFPLSSYVWLKKYLEKNEDGRSILYWLGYYQVRNAINLIKRKFGMEKDIANVICQQAEMVGMGVMKPMRLDIKEPHAIFKAIESTIAREYLIQFNIQKQGICDFNRGVSAGIVSMFNNKEVIAIETKCIAKGDKYCEYVVKEKSAFNLQDPKIKCQIPLKTKFFENFENMKFKIKF